MVCCTTSESVKEEGFGGAFSGFRKNTKATSQPRAIIVFVLILLFTFDLFAYGLIVGGSFYFDSLKFIFHPAFSSRGNFISCFCLLIAAQRGFFETPP